MATRRKAEPRPGNGQPNGQPAEELRRAVAESERRLAQAAELAARVRHEINNPLTGIIGQAQLLLLRGGLNEAARRRVQTIEHLAGRIRDAAAELRAVQPPGAVAATKDDAERGGEPPRH